MKYLLTFSLCLCGYISFADNPISGSSVVQPGSTETYMVNWESWESVYENYANVTWSVTGGTLLVSDKHSATIQWDWVPTWRNLYGGIAVSEDLGGQTGVLDVVGTANFTFSQSSFCEGVLGPPLVNITFGQGNNPGSPLPPGVTTYSYYANCALIHDEYTIRNSLYACRDRWHDIPSDHTPNDNNGYFLMVDGSENSGEFYRTTVTGLTQSFKYQFSVWAANFDLPILKDEWPDDYTDPRIVFQIRDLNNTILQSSGVIELPLHDIFTWEQISFMFSIPAGISSVQLVIMTQNGGTIGNDIVLDDISFAPCYPPIIASFSPNPTFVDKLYTCDNGSVNLYSWWPPPAPAYNNPGFQWQRSADYGYSWSNISGATTMTHTLTENTPGQYYYRLKAYDLGNPSSFLLSNTLKYFVQKMVVNAATFKVNGCTTAPFILTPTYSLQYSDPEGPPLNYSFNWSPSSFLSNSQIANPTITLPALPPLNPPNPPNPPPPVNYYYTLTVQNTNYGCSGSNTQTIAHYMPRKVYIPNAFTPNGDGNNDYFRPINIQDYSLFGAEFWIYNRWGNVIFYRNNGSTIMDWSWDGTVYGIPQASDVFVWRLKIPGCPLNYEGPGIQQDNPPVTIHGQVTLIR